MKITDQDMRDNGFSDAEHYYAGRILAGHAPAPDKLDESLRRAMDYIKKGQSTMNNEGASAVAVPGDVAGEGKTTRLMDFRVNIEAGLREFGIETDLAAEEMFELAMQCYSASLFFAVKSGMAFMAAQSALKITECDSVALDGTFQSWIESRGLAKERVYEAIRLAKGYLALPEAERKGYLQLGKYKAIKLAKIEPEALAELAETSPGMMGEFSLMSRKELVNRIANLEKNLLHEQQKTRSLAIAKARLTDYSELTEDVRHEACALQAEVEHPLNGLLKLFEHVSGLPTGDAEYQLRVEQVWICAHAAIARAADALYQIRQMAPEGMPERIYGQHMLTPQEAAHWLVQIETIRNTYEGKKVAREILRDEAKPRGRGRPAKNKAEA